MTRQALRATLVTAPDCHLCEHARQVLARLGQTWPFVVEEVAWNSPEGLALARRDGAPFPPALYIDGRLYGYGRLSEGRLRRLLAQRAAT
jgi:hypothetical protein